MFAPAGPCALLPANTGLIDNCEIPATFEIRLVTWLDTCDATSDSAVWLVLVLALFTAAASVVCPNASRLMMSACGSAGSDVYCVFNWLVGPSNRMLMLYCWIVVVSAM